MQTNMQMSLTNEYINYFITILLTIAIKTKAVGNFNVTEIILVMLRFDFFDIELKTFRSNYSILIIQKLLKE